MGTNYYQRINICEHCNRYDERHIGKSSAGWQFSFRGYLPENGFQLPAIISFEDWKKTLQAEGKIFNEYGQEISFEDFVKMVETLRSQPNNHCDYCKKNGLVSSENSDWKDKDGYSFSSYEFS